MGAGNSCDIALGVLGFVYNHVAAGLLPACFWRWSLKMSSVTNSVESLVDANPNVDTTATFDRFWAITCAMFARVQARFELTMDPCSNDLQPYSGVDGAAGSLAAYSGPEIDWLIHSWTGNPKASFTNMHLTINLGAHIDVPSFGFALGTMPDIFWYMDTMPRKELVSNPGYLDAYWTGEPNAALFAQLGQEGFTPFVSRDPYTRASLSPSAFCFSAKVSDAAIASIEAASHAALDRWLGWVDGALPLPLEQRAALAQRDEFLRRTICERDPANALAARLFGKELTDRLVATLWGGTRTLPRPT
jgi:Red chlorophyll catabolite reductase (RCC reductase)